MQLYFYVVIFFILFFRILLSFILVSNNLILFLSGDLSDLASQTENFALQHSRPYSSSPIQAPHNFFCGTELSPPPPPPSAPLSTSSSVGSRSSSYSSVVSNNNLDTSSNVALLTATNPIAARKPSKPCTNTPMATAAAPTAPENWTDFNLFADHGLSGNGF